jgi:glycosyltransferase involved in cell wall biosynthesis
VLPAWLCPPTVKRLLGRKIPDDVAEDHVTTAQPLALIDGLRRRLDVNASAATDAAPDWLRLRMMNEDFRSANALYCLDPGDIDVIRAAKQRGMAVVYEQIIAPHVGRILREERERFPGLEPQDSQELVESGIQLDREVWRMADLVLAPSPFVRDAMVDLGARPEAIGLVPYGLPEHWFGPIEARPVPGRILFVGGVGLRKGNHYLAEACRILASRGVQADVRVVGPYDAKQIAAPLFQGPTYVGQVPRSQVREEFLAADVFAFPTLAEGFALAHLEAMACGLPVVTTPNCGPAVRDGQDGFIVAPRDAVALADRLQELVSDRGLRDRMSESARGRAAEYSWSHYRQRLLGALDTVSASEERRAA